MKFRIDIMTHHSGGIAPVVEAQDLEGALKLAHELEAQEKRDHWDSYTGQKEYPYLYQVAVVLGGGKEDIIWDFMNGRLQTPLLPEGSY